MRLMSVIALALTGVTLSMVGDVFLKRASTLGSAIDVFLGLTFYVMGCVPVIFIFRAARFGSVFIIWESLTVIMAVLIGYTVFGEALTVRKIIAVFLVVSALLIAGTH
jgi:multidrug transporter EmrE-like cation transporter